MGSTFLNIIEDISTNSTRFLGPQFSGFIFDNQDRKIMNMREIFNNKKIYIDQLLSNGEPRYRFSPHYSVVGEINDIRVFNTFTSQKRVKFNGNMIKTLELDNKYFDYTTPLGFDINNIIDNYYIFYDIDLINKYDKFKKELIIRFILEKPNEIKLLKSISLEIVNEELIKNKKLDDILFLRCM